MSGNDLWWSQVQEMHEDMGTGEVHFKRAEVELFYRLYKRMKDDQYTSAQIRDHFESTFNIKYTAFYNRLRKVGKYYVL